MSENKHTPEPWRVSSSAGIKKTSIWNDDGTLIAELDKTKTVSLERARNNAARIVACVNACRGIPDEVLQVVGAFGGFGRDQMVEHVTKQRDGLQELLDESRANDRAAMGWLADCRIASGDNGKRMLPEFVEYLRDLKRHRDEMLVALEDIIDLYDGRKHEGIAIVANARATIDSAKGGA